MLTAGRPTIVGPVRRRRSGYSSALVIDPTQGLAVAVTCNIDGFDAEDRADVVLEVWRG